MLWTAWRVARELRHANVPRTLRVSALHTFAVKKSTFSFGVAPFLNVKCKDLLFRCFIIWNNNLLELCVQDL